MSRGIQKKGFSVIEVLSDCPIFYGRLNALGSAVEMLKWYQDNTITIAAAEKGSGAGGKILRGVLVDRDLPEYTEEYRKLVARVQRMGIAGEQPLRDTSGG